MRRPPVSPPPASPSPRQILGVSGPSKRGSELAAAAPSGVAKAATPAVCINVLLETLPFILLILFCLAAPTCIELPAQTKHQVHQRLTGKGRCGFTSGDLSEQLGISKCHPGSRPVES